MLIPSCSNESLRQIRIDEWISWRLRLLLKYWYMRKGYSLGLHTNVRQLITLQNKLSIEHKQNMFKADIFKELQATHKQRVRIQLMAAELSLEYRIKLAMVKEEAGELKAAVFLRNHIWIEEQDRVVRNIRRMEGKMKGISTTKVTIVDEYSNSAKLINRSDIDLAMANGKEKLVHQKEGGSQLLTTVFVESLGLHGEGPIYESVLQVTYIFPPDTTEGTRDYITAYTYNPEVNSVLKKESIAARYVNTKKLWEIWKENTCTYGKHMGHYKANMRYD